MSCRGAFIETIEVDVIEEQPATVRVDQSERRTGYFLFVDAKSMCNAFYKNRLTRAKTPVQKNNVPARELIADANADVERFTLAV